MPHIVLEFTDNIDLDVPVVLGQLHVALLQAAGADVDVMKLKTRAMPVSHSVIKDAPYNAGRMMHVCLSLLTGRDVDTRARYGRALYDVLLRHAPDADCAVTCEVREMDRATYFN